MRQHYQRLGLSCASLPLPSRREVRAQDELDVEAARFETAVSIGYIIEAYLLGDARPNSAGCQ